MSDIASLLVRVEPLTPEHTIAEVGELLLSPDYRQFLSLPVVDGTRPLGTVSRYRMQNIFMSRFGRDLYGRSPIGGLEGLINPRPLVVSLDQAMEEASQYITRNIEFPVTEDFIITDDAGYNGVGFVIDLLRAMEQRVGHRNAELARAYRRLKSSQAQLVQSEKMASLGQMVAGVAHEINTPLGYVKNNIEMAREMFREVHRLVGAYGALLELFCAEQPDETRIAAQLAQVQTLRRDLTEAFSYEEVEGLYDDTLYGLDQISEMVLNLKNFSRLDQAAQAEVNLNDSIDSSLLIARNLLKHKAEVIKQYGELPRISCAPSQINQVFLNLLSNAAQAIEGQGRILIKTYADEQWVYALVRDSGRGIAKENLRRIFDPFFTTKPVGEGTGLGLSITYQIVRQHGGRIRVASEPGKGTAFLILLPRNPTPREAS